MLIEILCSLSQNTFVFCCCARSLRFVSTRRMFSSKTVGQGAQFSQLLVFTAFQLEYSFSWRIVIDKIRHWLISVSLIKTTNLIFLMDIHCLLQNGYSSTWKHGRWLLDTTHFSKINVLAHYSTSPFSTPSANTVYCRNSFSLSIPGYYLPSLLGG